MDAELARIVAFAMGGAGGICAIIGWTVTNIARSRALGAARVVSEPEDQRRVEDLDERVAELE